MVTRADKNFKIIMCLLLTIWSLFVLIPIALMFINTFKTGHELAFNSWGWPQNFVFDNYQRLMYFNGGVIMRAYFNAIFVSTTYTILTLGVASLAAFAFSKYRFRGATIIFALLLGTMMIPPEVTLPPLFILFARIGWLNTYQVQIFPGIANVFCMFLFKQYMDGMPNSLVESARIDGAGHFKVYSRIMLPICMPAVGALTILTFLAKFNEFVFPQLMITNQRYMPIMVILPMLNDHDNLWNIPWELLMTGCAIVVIPLIAVFFAFQKYFMSSVTLGAVKE